MKGREIISERGQGVAGEERLGEINGRERNPERDSVNIIENLDIYAATINDSSNE